MFKNWRSCWNDIVKDPVNKIKERVRIMESIPKYAYEDWIRGSETLVKALALQ